MKTKIAKRLPGKMYGLMYRTDEPARKQKAKRTMRTRKP